MADPGSQKSERISVVLSLRNEEEVIPELVRRLEAALSALPLDYELIFVNDDSTDRSLDILREHAVGNPRVKVLTMSRRFGVFECTLAGIDYASGDAVVFMDADLQDPPEVIPQLVDKWRDGADMVYTVRTRRLGEHPLRMWFTRAAYRVIGAISEIDLPVEAGDFRLLSRRLVNEVVRLKESDPYLKGLVTWVGFNRAAVPYVREPRAAGTTHNPLFRSTSVSAGAKLPH
ncbi:MAG: glycosyltransferase family 2 protein [Proteobacteria bacterium]|nr:glycosyltransferase family 2 protein [Pseudomonadota bacterium]MDA1133213.1 glycosyltransferase family 2 protein [Pseudomonadota bacterium]